MRRLYGLRRFLCKHSHIHSIHYRKCVCLPRFACTLYVSARRRQIVHTHMFIAPHISSSVLVVVGVGRAHPLAPALSNGVGTRTHSPFAPVHRIEKRAHVSPIVGYTCTRSCCLYKLYGTYDRTATAHHHQIRGERSGRRDAASVWGERAHTHAHVWRLPRAWTATSSVRAPLTCKSKPGIEIKATPIAVPMCTEAFCRVRLSYAHRWVYVY